MGVLDVFRNKKSKDEIKQQANEIVSAVENSLDTENESITQIANQFSKEIKEAAITDSDVDNIADLSDEDKQKVIHLYTSVLKVIKENENIPEEVWGKIVLDLIQNSSKKIGVAVAKNTAKDLPDDSIKEIIATPEVGEEDARKLLEKINDDDIRKSEEEKLNIEKLNKIYDDCASMPDGSIINKIKKILETIDEKSEKINETINKIIAKKIAVNFSNFGTSLIKGFNKIISPLEMLEIDLLNLVNAEYKKIEKDNIGNLKPYDKDILKNAIIQELGKEIASQYLAQPVSNRRIIIPESEKIKEFTTEEEDKLIDSIESACKVNPPKQYELQDVRNQIHGRANTEEVSELSSKLYSIDNSEIRIKLANNCINMIDVMEKLSDDDKEKFIAIIDSVTQTVAERVLQMESNVNDNQKTDNVRDFDREENEREQ